MALPALVPIGGLALKSITAATAAKAAASVGVGVAGAAAAKSLTGKVAARRAASKAAAASARRTSSKAAPTYFITPGGRTVFLRSSEDKTVFPSITRLFKSFLRFFKKNGDKVGRGLAVGSTVLSNSSFETKNKKVTFKGNAPARLGGYSFNVPSVQVSNIDKRNRYSANGPNLNSKTKKYSSYGRADNYRYRNNSSYSGNPYRNRKH